MSREIIIRSGNRIVIYPLHLDDQEMTKTVTDGAVMRHW